jgi:hypothetical protein
MLLDFKQELLAIEATQTLLPPISNLKTNEFLEQRAK